MIFRILSTQWLAVAYVGAISFVLSVMIARALGPEAFGYYSIVISAGAIIAIVLDGGFSKLLQREHASVDANAAYTETNPQLTSKAYIHLLISALFFSIASIVFYPEKSLLLIITLAFYSAMVFNQFGLSILRGRGKFIKDAAWQIGNRSFSAFAVFLVILLGANRPREVLAALFLGSFIFAIIIAKNIQIKFKWIIDKKLYAIALPLMWLELANTLYFRSDIVLLGYLGVNNADIAHYGVAHRLIEAGLLFAYPIGAILFRKFRQDKQFQINPLGTLKIPLIYAFAIGIIIASLFHLVGYPLILYTFGNKYLASVNYLQTLCWCLVFIFPNTILTQALIAAKLERWCAIILTIAAVFNILANYYLVPIYGIDASAFIAVGTEILICFFFFWAIQQNEPRK